MHLLCREQMLAPERILLLATIAFCETMLTPRIEFAQGIVPGSINVAAEQLTAKQPAQDWLSYNGDYTGRRYSSLSQINLENVAELRVQWVFHSTNSDRLEVTPVVLNGLMLVTSANDAYALDARTGRAVWHHAMSKSEGLIDDASSHLNRGVAVWHSRAYMNTDN